MRQDKSCSNACACSVNPLPHNAESEGATTIQAHFASFVNTLSTIPMTLIGGALLILSFLQLLDYVHFPVDPAWGTVLICGLPLMYSGWMHLLQDNIRASLLIAIAIIASIAIGEVFAAGEVAFIMAIGGILEDRTVARTRRGLEGLMSLRPQQGRRLVSGTEALQGAEEMVSVEDILQGDILRVLPGEVIPVDGTVVAGTSSVDQSIMTGESLPVEKVVGDALYCGTINRFGAIDMEATHVGQDSSLQKLIRMVEEAEQHKAPMQRIVDVWATRLVPTALLIAVITYVLSADIIRAVTVLVVFCPCALALATPTSIVAAIGQATRHGVIIKSGEALEAMGKVDTIALDKTGTITQGKLQVSDCLPVASSGTWTAEEILRLAASVECRSEHPLGKAITQAFMDAAGTTQSLYDAEDFVMNAGKGVRAIVAGKNIVCGTVAYVEEHGILVSQHAHEALDRVRKEGKAAVLVAVKHDTASQCVGVIALSDTIRPHVKEMVTALQRMKTDVVLLTGDHTHTAAHVAAQTGIEHVHAELLPEQKVLSITNLQESGHHVCMVGDGVNDAPSLKTAHVGVAMAHAGSDIAVEAADIALMGDDISKLPYLKRLSNATLNTIKFNLAMAMIINFGAIGLSVVGVLNPITGALVHNAGSVLVVLNAAYLYDRKLTI